MNLIHLFAAGQTDFEAGQNRQRAGQVKNFPVSATRIRISSRFFLLGIRVSKVLK